MAALPGGLEQSSCRRISGEPGHAGQVALRTRLGNGSWVADLNVATKLSASPASISYNTQGALNELPLD
ncbi:hypothetical protein DSO57_1038738, partial [Entomophthora muscae]